MPLQFFNCVKPANFFQCHTKHLLRDVYPLRTCNGHVCGNNNKKDHHTYCGGLANASERTDHRWHVAYQWFDDDPSCGEQAATPHPISVYTKLNDCQASLLPLVSLITNFLSGFAG